MIAGEIIAAAEAQKTYYRSGKTLEVSGRVERLKKLYAAIKANEAEIHEAIRADLGKCADESYMCETGLVLAEISFLLKHIKKFASPHREKTPLAQAVSRSYRLPTPYGCVLVISPWNYPFLLGVQPLCEAIAAGNTVMLKTSSSSPNTGRVISKLISETLESGVALAVEGGEGINEALENIKFDYIFFTGSHSVGRPIYERAARDLTPVTLELGGKSPCIVDGSAAVPTAARRIVFGKFLNLGQTCVAPDYVLVHESVHDRLLDEIKIQIKKQFGGDPLNSPDYGKIVNRKHFNRLRSLIMPQKTVYGGKCDESRLSIEPTVLDGVSESDPVMSEEIFGPILPVLTYKTDEEALGFISSRPVPLALYIFSSDRKKIKKFLTTLDFGGGCVNDTVVHLSTHYLPFGGFKDSGMGAYHGKSGFDTFTHYKSILDKKIFPDIPLRYRPYTKKKRKTVRKFLR